MILFSVIGVPVPQGSKRVFGRAVVETNQARLKPWRQEVAAAAQQQMDGPPLTDPVEVALIFYLPRPKGHYGTGKYIQRLRPSAPAYPAGKPDLDKLVRAVLDAITGSVIRDDAQVAHLAAQKQYADEHGPGLSCTVAPLARRLAAVAQ